MLVCGTHFTISFTHMERMNEEIKNVMICTLGAVWYSNTVAVLHHCDKTGDFEFLRCLLIFIL